MSNQDDPHRYDDMIQMPHPTSKSHPPMSRLNRAAQFAPFAALTGYDAKVREVARITERKIELDEDSRSLLDETLRQIQEQIEECPEVEVTYFEKDDQKEGGSYHTIQDKIKKIDTYTHMLIMVNGIRIPLEDVIDIQLS